MNSSEYVNDRSNLGVVQDPNIKIKPSDKLKAFIAKNSEDLNVSSGVEYLSIGEIKDLWKKVHGTINPKSKDSGEKIYLNELLVGSEVILPQLKVPERDPELEKRIEKLRNSLAQKEYKRMTKDVDFTTRYKPEDTVGYQMKQMNADLIGVFQFVISIAAAFMFGYMGFDTFFGLTLELAVKLLLGIIFALVVGCAELYFLAKNLHFSEALSDPDLTLTVKKAQ